jgi:amino acid transporter
MMSVFFINFILEMFAFITIAYHIPVIDDALNDPSLYPIVYVLRQSMSVVWQTVLLTFILFLLVCSNITYLAAVTRDLWAFARDDGLPASRWIARVDHKRHIPGNAIKITSFIAFCLSFIYIGSPTAFYAMTSVVGVALLQCYSFSIGCLLWRRIYLPDTLPAARYSLGKWGIPINAAGFLYAIWAFFWTFWPTVSPVTADNFNWAVVIFGTVLIGAAIYYAFKGRHKYVGPVMNIKKVHVG